MPSAEPAPVAATEPFVCPGFRGELAAGHRPADVAAAVARLTDPANATETLHWGRNYLYATRFPGAPGEPEVVVKQFRNQTLAERLRRRWGGSKAERSWRAALALAAAGVPTPAPVAWIESERADGPSFYVSLRLAGFVEARYYLRARNAGREAAEFPEIDPARLLAHLGGLLRRMHDAGIWHRDVSIGNLLLQATRDGLVVHLVDLNRARLGRRLGALRRSRDLSRLRLLRPSDRAALLAAYWGRRPGPWKRLLYGAGFHGFLLKNSLKEHLRRPLRLGRGARPARHPHVHIPAAESGAGVRDRVVWDRLSDQPHQHAGRLERMVVRLADGGDHARSAAAALAAAPRIWRRYRRLRRELYAEPRPWQGIGVAIRPLGGKADERQLAAVEELGVRRLLLRLHPWQEDHRAEEELARRLVAAGCELAFTLPQSRELVRDPGRWRSAVAELGERFRPLGRHFQVGQAVNRSKWGIWRYGEYLELAATACELLRRHPETEVLGPAVIDFEPHATAALLNRRAPGVLFDAVASQLYVDRRGAPENPQLGLDAEGKVVLLKAIAETARNSTGRSWITEFNWPLWEGPHSPAGRDVAVDERTQADYLARYLLLALGTGMVERLYWWQLTARGYGLLDPGPDGLRRRPAFRALRTLAAELEGRLCLGPLAAAGPARLLRFRDEAGGELVAAWSSGAAAEAELPRPAAGAVSLDGEAVTVSGAVSGRRVAVTGSPLLVRLEGSSR